MDIYKKMLEETLDGKKTITELIHKFSYDNMYLLKITFFFPDKECKTYNTIGEKHEKGHLYYIFYSDQTPDAGVHGFITNSEYVILTIPDEFIWDKDDNNLDNTDIYEDYLCDNTTETDKIFINKILKYFHSHYEGKRIVDEDGDEVLINTNEYWKNFTLVNNDEKDENNYTIFNKNDKRINNLINTLVCHNFLKDIDYKNEKEIIINKEEFIFSFNKHEESFTFGWYDSTYQSGSTEFWYTFKMNNDKINLTYQYISDKDKEYDIKDAYEQLWNKVINEHVMKDWLSKFFNEIEKYINCEICDMCHKKILDEKTIYCNICKQYQCDTCNIICHDSRCR